MIKIQEADITTIHADVIVNAANELLIHGGGVARAIAQAAGPELIKECREIISKYGALSVGDAVYTSAGKLPAKYVIHVVGPRGTKPKLLEKALISVFELAKKLSAKTIAIPPVSCGAFGFDKKKGAEILVRISEKYEPDFKEIFLVSLDSEIISYLKRILSEP